MVYFKLLRVPLLAIIAIAQLVLHYTVTTHIVGMDYTMPTLNLALIVATTVIIAAGGFVINDYYDMRIDEINHPLTRIVGNDVSKHSAMNIYIFLFALGVILSIALGFVFHNTFTSFIMVSMIGLLWFYSSSYKRTLIVGNLITSLSFAMVPFILALFEGRWIMQWWMEKLISNGILITDENLSKATPTISYNYEIIGYFSILIFAMVFVHEIIRNLDEEHGEREMECHTIPIVYGKDAAKYAVYTILAVVNISCIAAIAKHIDDIQLIVISYYVCTVLAFSGGLILFVKNAEYPKDYKTCLFIAKLIICSIVAYGFLYAYLHPIDWIDPTL